MPQHFSNFLIRQNYPTSRKIKESNPCSTNTKKTKMLGEYHGQEKGEINFGNSTGNKINYILNFVFNFIFKNDLFLKSCRQIMIFAGLITFKGQLISKRIYLTSHVEGHVDASLASLLLLYFPLYLVIVSIDLQA